MDLLCGIAMSNTTSMGGFYGAWCLSVFYSMFGLRLRLFKLEICQPRRTQLPDHLGTPSLHSTWRLPRLPVAREDMGSG